MDLFGERYTSRKMGSQRKSKKTQGHVSAMASVKDKIQIGIGKFMREITGWISEYEKYRDEKKSTKSSLFMPFTPDAMRKRGVDEKIAKLRKLYKNLHKSSSLFEQDEEEEDEEEDEEDNLEEGFFDSILLGRHLSDIERLEKGGKISFVSGKSWKTAPSVDYFILALAINPKRVIDFLMDKRKRSTIAHINRIDSIVKVIKGSRKKIKYLKKQIKARE